MIATVKGIEYISSEEGMIKLVSKNEKGKLSMQMMLYVPIEEVQNYFLGQVFSVDLGGV